MRPHPISGAFGPADADLVAAATVGDPDAALELADRTEGHERLRWLVLAAGGPSVEAAVELGHYWADLGRAAPAALWFQVAAALGRGDAHWRRVSGSPRADRVAKVADELENRLRQWGFEEAARQEPGDREDMVAIQAVPDAEARKNLLALAAEQGNSLAAELLGRQAIESNDRESARRWWMLGAAAGSEECIDALAGLGDPDSGQWDSLATTLLFAAAFDEPGGL